MGQCLHPGPRKAPLFVPDFGKEQPSANGQEIARK
jgi:hypothetical protein